MSFNKLTPNLMVEDVAQSIIFYRDTLGFELVMAMRDEKPVESLPETGDAPLDWAMVQRDQVAFMFQQRKSLVGELSVLDGEKIGASLILYIEIDGVDALYKSFDDKVDVIRPPQTTFYGRREMYLRDCSGYILALTEEAGN